MSAVCLAKAIEQRQFKRAFKQDVTVMSSCAMVTHVRQLLADRVTGLLGLANKAGKITSGGSMVSDALRSKHKPGLVLLASNVSAAIGEKILLLASVQHVPLHTALTKEDFGSILGKAPRSAISIAAGGFVVPLRTAIERYVNFLGEV
jgi:ribosomal protein L7Ae-like RNA K-turn-binding protein